MKFTITKEIELNVSDNIQVLTEDGWLYAVIKVINQDQLKVYIEDYGEHRYFSVNDIRT